MTADTPETMMQAAPYPTEFVALLDGLQYKPNFEFEIKDIDRGQGSVGLTLVITITTPNSYNHAQTRRVAHYMPLPPAAFDRRSWQRWLLDQILLVESHEACEFFTVDGVKPYAPSHGPGNDPYMIREVGTVADVETSFRGERKMSDV